MPFIYRNLTTSPHDEEENLPALLASLIGIGVADLADFRIIRKGVDARRKSQVKLIYTLSFTTVAHSALQSRLASIPNLEWQPEPPATVFPKLRSQQQIVIVGSGPAGIFTALRLARYGLTATIIERGQPVEQRARDVQQFWTNGLLDPESNVQFGEGGAGTFSDGKLTCRSKDLLVPWVLEQFAAFGAQPEVRYLAKPHIGTDRLRTVVALIRKELVYKGFTFRFGCRMSDLEIDNGQIK